MTPPTSRPTADSPMDRRDLDDHLGLALLNLEKAKALMVTMTIGLPEHSPITRASYSGMNVASTVVIQRLQDAAREMQGLCDLFMERIERMDRDREKG